MHIKRASDGDQPLREIGKDAASVSRYILGTGKDALHLFAGWSGGIFLEVGVPVATRTTPPPKLDEAAQAEFKAKAAALAPKYRTELLQHA